ncbi:MAG: S41 family peptidase [Acidobacteriaceae bacterium]
MSKEQYLAEFESAPAPDGKAIVMMAKGISDQQWWRDGHSHIGDTELWWKSLAPRGLPAAPARQLPGQRALGKPTVLVTNGSTLLDGEDFTQGCEALHLGKVVGTPTAGWIIYTGGTNLIDGSYLRLPMIRVQTLSGQTMEMHPRPVNVEVVRKPGETESNTDSQLQAAVKVLLGLIAQEKK